MDETQRALLKARMKKKGVTYDLLALKTGIPRTSVFSLMRGEMSFRAWHIEAIKKYLNISYRDTYKIFIENSKPTKED